MNITINFEYYGEGLIRIPNSLADFLNILAEDEEVENVKVFMEEEVK
jgi:hypothetical protein